LKRLRLSPVIAAERTPSTGAGGRGPASSSSTRRSLSWRRRPNPATTDERPRGVEAIELDGEPHQVLFFIREHATLVSGDVLSGTGLRSL
jgi:hypothetical protein